MGAEGTADPAAEPASEPAAQREPCARASPPGRLLFVDNLRWSAISMVVVLHAAVTYSGVGAWYVRDRLRTGRPAVIGLATYQSLQHAVAMGLLFGIAGYFAAGAIARHGPAAFLRERAFRLGMPLLLYTLAVGPLTEFDLAGTWRSRPARGFWAEWLAHVADGRILGGSGPLWFCLVLLAFCLVLAGLRLAGLPLAPRPAAAVPGPAAIAAFALATALLTSLVGLVAPAGTTVLNVAVHDLPQYPLTFAAGVAAHRGDWLRRFPARYGRAGVGLGIGVGLAWWFAMLEVGGAFRGELAAFGGGPHWQAFAMDLWRSGVCVSLGIGLVVLYRERFDRQGALARALTRNAFGVYVFHAPILIAITVGLRGSALDGLAKFALASVAAVALSFLCVGLARRAPGLRAIL